MLKQFKLFLGSKATHQIERLILVFLATFGITLLENGEHIMGAGGLSALKSAFPALVVTAILAGWQKVRPSLPANLVPGVEDPAGKVDPKTR